MPTIDMVYLEPTTEGLIVHTGERDLNYPPIYDVREGVVYGHDSGLTGTLTTEADTPSIPTATVTDKQDGTGAELIISTADSDTTNNIYTCPVNANSWTLTQTITANGSTTLSLAQGSYWLYVESINGGGNATTKPIVFSITDSTNLSLAQEIRHALRTQLLSQNSIVTLLKSTQGVYYKKAALNAQKPYILYSDIIPTNSSGALQYHYNFEILSDRPETSTKIFEEISNCLTPFASSNASIRMIELSSAKNNIENFSFEIILTAYSKSENSSFTYDTTTINLPAPEINSQSEISRYQAEGKSLSGQKYVYDRGSANPEFNIEYKALNEAEKQALSDFFNNCAKGMMNIFEFTDAAGNSHNVSFADTNITFSTPQKAQGIYQTILKLLKR